MKQTFRKLWGLALFIGGHTVIWIFETKGCRSKELTCCSFHNPRRMVDYCDPYRTEKGVYFKELSLLALGGNGISWGGCRAKLAGSGWMQEGTHSAHWRGVDSGSNGPRENAFSIFSWPTFRYVILLYQQQNSDFQRCPVLVLGNWICYIIWQKRLAGVIKNLELGRHPGLSWKWALCNHHKWKKEAESRVRKMWWPQVGLMRATGCWQLSSWKRQGTSLSPLGMSRGCTALPTP